MEYHIFLFLSSQQKKQQRTKGHLMELDKVIFCSKLFRNCFGKKKIAFLGSISPTFYVQLLHMQIPKAQKDSQFKQLFALLGSASKKAACKHVEEIGPGLHF